MQKQAADDLADLGKAQRKLQRGQQLTARDKALLRRDRESLRDWLQAYPRSRPSAFGKLLLDANLD